MVNIIIPVYKAMETLPKLLDSLLAQTNPRFLVTLSQDGDGENYSELIQSYNSRGLHINLIKSDDNTGPGGARQRAMDRDTMCDYWMFADADDVFTPTAVATLTREIQVNKSDIAISSFLREQKYKPSVVMDAASTPVTWLHGKCYRAQYLRDNEIRFLEGLRLNEDAYFNLVACNCTEKKIRIEEVTYIWRDNPESLTRREVDGDFFKRSWVDYIISQVMALKRISEIKGVIDPGLVAATLIHTYSYHMRAIADELPMGRATSFLRRLAANPQIKEAIQTEEFWQFLMLNLKQGIFINERVIFYRTRFCDWLKTYCPWEE